MSSVASINNSSRTNSENNSEQVEHKNVDKPIFYHSPKITSNDSQYIIQAIYQSIRDNTKLSITQPTPHSIKLDLDKLTLNNPLIVHDKEITTNQNNFG